MTFKYLFLFTISIFSISVVKAQTPANLTASQPNNLFLKKLEESALADDKNSLVDVKGSIFLNDDFVGGEIHIVDDPFKIVEMKYNILGDVFYFKLGQQTLVLDPRADLEKVVLGDVTFVVRQYEFKNKNVAGFLEVKVQGKYSLFNKKNITLRPAKPPAALQSVGTPAEYTRPSDTIYFGMPNGKLEKVKTGKDVIYLLKNPQIKAMAKSKGISLNKSKDLPSLIEMLNAFGF